MMVVNKMYLLQAKVHIRPWCSAFRLPSHSVREVHLSLQVRLAQDPIALNRYVRYRWHAHHVYR